MDACTLWGSRKESSLAEILVDQGWLISDDREHVEYLLKRRMEKAGGNAKKSLAGMPADVKNALESIGDQSIRNSISAMPTNKRIIATMQISPTVSPDDRITRRD